MAAVGVLLSVGENRTLAGCETGPLVQGPVAIVCGQGEPDLVNSHSSDLVRARSGSVQRGSRGII